MTADGLEEENLEGIFEEIVEGAGVSFISKVFSQGVETLFTYTVTLLAGAPVYGKVSVLSRMTRFLVLSFSGVGTAVQRSIPRVSNRSGSFLVSFSSVLTAAALGMIGILSGYVFDGYILRYSLLEKRPVVVLFGIGLVLSGLLWILSDSLKAYRKISYYNLSKNVIAPVLKISLVLGLLIFASRSVESAWLGVIISFGAAASISYIILLNESSYSPFGGKLDREDLADFLEFAGNATITSLSENMQLGTFFLLTAIYLSPVEAGVFGTSLVLGAFTRYPLLAVNQIFPPMATRLYNENRQKELNELYRRTTRIVAAFSIPLASLLIVYNKEIMPFFSEDYVGFAFVLPLVVLAKMFGSSMGSVGVMLSMTDRESQKAKIQTGVAIVTVVSAYVLTVKYGILGLAVGYLGKSVLNNISEMVYLSRSRGVQPFNMSYVKILVLGCLCFGFTALGESLGGPALSGVASALAWIGFTTYVWRTLDSIDRKVIKHLYRALKNLK